MSDHDPKSPWDDPDVKRALKSRPADDVYLCPCGDCGSYGYYNQGAHFTCSWCGWYADGDMLDRMIEDGDVITLDDYAGMSVFDPEGD